MCSGFHWGRCRVTKTRLVEYPERRGSAGTLRVIFRAAPVNL